MAKEQKPVLTAEQIKENREAKKQARQEKEQKRVQEIIESEFADYTEQINNWNAKFAIAINFLTQTSGAVLAATSVGYKATGRHTGQESIEESVVLAVDACEIVTERNYSVDSLTHILQLNAQIEKPEILSLLIKKPDPRNQEIVKALNADMEKLMEVERVQNDISIGWEKQFYLSAVPLKFSREWNSIPSRVLEAMNQLVIHALCLRIGTEIDHYKTNLKSSAMTKLKQTLSEAELKALGLN